MARGQMDPDRFQMRDMKRRLSGLEKKYDILLRKTVALRLETRALRSEILAISAPPLESYEDEGETEDT